MLLHCINYYFLVWSVSFPGNQWNFYLLGDLDKNVWFFYLGFRLYILILLLLASNPVSQQGHSWLSIPCKRDRNIPSLITAVEQNHSFNPFFHLAKIRLQAFLISPNSTLPQSSLLTSKSKECTPRQNNDHPFFPTHLLKASCPQVWNPITQHK